MAEPVIEPKPRPVGDGLRILDMIGLVIGYGLAAVLVRFILFGPHPMTVGHAIAVTLVYLWAGLAMSGPFILLLDQRGPVASGAVPRSDPPARYTGEEITWIGIGLYFVGLTLFISPAREHETLGGMIFGYQAVVGLLLLIGLWGVRRNRPNVEASAPRWTRRAAAFVIVTWPGAWMIVIWLTM